MIERNLDYYIAKQDISTKPSLRHLFFAEGDSEAFLLEKLLGHLGADRTTTGVVCFNGISANFKEKVALPAKFSNFSQIIACGFFLDADDNPAGRAGVVAEAALAIRFPRPDGSGRAENDGRRTAVFVSPGDGAVGRIEDVVLREVAATPLWPCLVAYSECSGAAGVNLDSKALVQTYISSRRPGLCGVGRAFDANILDVTNGAYDLIREFATWTLGG
jgi:hypothetical protein